MNIMNIKGFEDMSNSELKAMIVKMLMERGWHVVVSKMQINVLSVNIQLGVENVIDCLGKGIENGRCAIYPVDGYVKSVTIKIL